MFKKKSGKDEPDTAEVTTEMPRAPESVIEKVSKAAVSPSVDVKALALALIDKHVTACNAGASIGLAELRKLRADIAAL